MRYISQLSISILLSLSCTIFSAETSSAQNTHSTSSVVGYFRQDLVTLRQSQALGTAITFSEFPLNTFITTQYSSRGIVFGGDNPFVTTDGANPTSPVLSGSPLFAGAIEGRFVDSTGHSATVTQLSLDAGYFDALNSTRLTWYDSSDHVISSVLNSQFGIETFVVSSSNPRIARWRLETVGSEPAGFAIDNVAFDTPSNDNRIIASPSDGAKFPLKYANASSVPTTDQVTYRAFNANSTNWKASLTYSTSSNRGPFTPTPRTFTTTANATHSDQYSGIGGQVTVSATQGAISDHVTITVTGHTIPDADITARLASLYSDGATTHLMTGIAQRESSYHQFVQLTLFGQSALWPTESAEARPGSHIGLMQVPLALDVAWNWLENTSQAVSLFRDKLATAARLETRIRKASPGLRPLSGVERENMALVLYGPAASGDLTMQYYNIQCGGIAKAGTCVSWQWVKNTALNPDGVAYADTIRSLMK